MRLTPLICLVFLASCGEFPAIGGAQTTQAARAPFPALVSLGPILAQADGMASATASLPDPGAPVLSRAAALRARAAALRGPVIDAATRARMRAGVDSSALR